MFCPKCNHPVDEKAEICPICGKTLRHRFGGRILAVIGILAVIAINLAIILYLRWRI